MNIIGDEENQEQQEDEFVPNQEIDTGLKMQQFMIQPTAEEKFKWITKDMPLTYLDELDIEKVRQLCGLINTLEDMGLHDSAKLFYGDLASLLVSARARHGFERQMQQTSISKGFQYFDAEEERKKNILSR